MQSGVSLECAVPDSSGCLLNFNVTHQRLSCLQDDERRMMGRQINGTSEGVPGSLWKQGSLNLPAPEESGFPATHPDMCILRIRRNHLLEVGRCGEGAKGGVLGGSSAIAGLSVLGAAALCAHASAAHWAERRLPSPCPPPPVTGRPG